MQLIYLVLCSFALTNSHKVGLILPDYAPTAAIKDVAEYTLSELGSNITLVTKEYSSTYLSLLDTICELLSEGVVAIVSGSGSTYTAIEAEVTSQYHMPYLSAVATNPYLKTADRDYLILLTSSDKYQSQVAFDMVKRFNWLEFSILASADDYGINSVVYLQYLATRDGSFNIRNVQHFDITKDASQLDVTKELQLIKASLTRIIVLSCAGRYAKIIFKEAKKLGLMDSSFVWLTTDAVAGEPESLSYNSSYPSYYDGLLGTVPSYGQDTTAYNTYQDKYITKYGGMASNLMMNSVRVSDGLSVVHEALSSLDGTGEWDSVSSLRCSSNSTWPGGQTLRDAILGNTFTGVTGEITFDDEGTTSTTDYDIMNFKGQAAFHKVGSWSNTTKLSMDTRKVQYLGGVRSAPTGFGNTLSGFHMRVGIVQEPPIAYLDKETCFDDISLPHCWYGWNPDIIFRLSRDLNFTFEYVQPADSKYGGFDPETETWNGMIKDLLDHKTDLTIALSINTERSKYIDFTLSFFEDQASYIVFSQTAKSSSNIFFFLLPFKNDVWFSIIGIILLISFVVCMLGKLSPYGKYGGKVHSQQTCTCEECKHRKEMKEQYGCSFEATKKFDCLVDKVEEEDILNNMNFYNSLWVISTGFVKQEGESLPAALSGRFLLFTWWLFVMILVSMYTANLTAHLTLENNDVNIKSMQDLSSQTVYEWGLITDRNLESMMENHANPEYGELVQRGVKLENLDEGIERVQEGGFVFIDESSVLTFNFRENCTAYQVNTGKFSNEWAFGLQTNSPYATVINNMFLRYREEGWFAEVWDKWYKAEAGCSAYVGSDMRFDLTILSGLFAVFLMGIAISLLLVVIETLYAAYSDRRASHGKVGFWHCLSRRLQHKKNEIIEEWLGGSHIRSCKRNGVDRETIVNVNGEMAAEDRLPRVVMS